MNLELIGLPLAFLFLANVGSIIGQTEPAPADVLWYDVRGNLTLRCQLPAAKDEPYVWKKNGTDVSEVPVLKGRYELKQGGSELWVKGRSVEDDFGPYTCSVGGDEQALEVRGRTHARLPANSQVVEGQKLKLTCRLTGRPYANVSWTYNSSTDALAGEDVQQVLGERATLQRSEQGVEGAELLLADVARTDAGLYWCGPAGGPRAVTRLHVKDMYAALWPFLGICAEVLVLCAVILLYERRRTKPEMEDSDTDNHDQKKS